MKPYCNVNGKAAWNLFWGDKSKSRHKKVFKKSARQKLIKQTEIEVIESTEDWNHFNDLLATIYDEDWCTKLN